jgi:hypothetical protein
MLSDNEIVIERQRYWTEEARRSREQLEKLAFGKALKLAADITSVSSTPRDLSYAQQVANLVIADMT